MNTNVNELYERNVHRCTVHVQYRPKVGVLHLDHGDVVRAISDRQSDQLRIRALHEVDHIRLLHWRNAAADHHAALERQLHELHLQALCVQNHLQALYRKVKQKEINCSESLN